MTDVPKIFVFSNTRRGGEGICYAMAEDGTVLGSHLCSHEVYARHDLGVIAGSRKDRHVDYAKHYPDGYEMEFVYAKDVLSHKGLMRAFELNQKQGKEAKESR